MKYDTSIQDIIDKIPHMKEMGFRRLLATPIFGQDNLSTHGYWTNNPFQITSRYGNMHDFQKLQIELFKNSMGYIADGAFTAQLTNKHEWIVRFGESYFDPNANIKITTTGNYTFTSNPTLVNAIYIPRSMTSIGAFCFEETNIDKENNAINEFFLW